MQTLIIGCGTMGTSYGLSFLRSHVTTDAQLMLLEKSVDKLAGLRAMGFRRVYADYRDCIDEAELVIFAVKPQDFGALVEEIASGAMEGKLVLSIMAGIKIETISRALSVDRIVRAMPNLPAQIGAGVTVFTASAETSRKDLLFVQNLINTTGKSVYVDEEKMIDAATSISGSGPAYVFELMKIMTRTGQELGFSQAEAELLVLQTFRGTIDIFTKKDLTFDQWVDMVASRGGTTEAALEQFGKNDLSSAFRAGILAAYRRAVSLGEKEG